MLLPIALCYMLCSCYSIAVTVRSQKAGVCAPRVVSADVVDAAVNLEEGPYPMSGGGGRSSSCEGGMGEPGS